MAGAEFDADDPSFGEDFSPEDIQANLPGEEINKARLILERYIRDFSRSVEKKVIGLESALVQFEGKKAPSSKDFEDLEYQVTLMLEREASRLAKLEVQLEKEFDGIETRLKTQGGVEGDYEDIANAKAELEALIERADDDYIRSAQAIIQRGRERIEEIDRQNAEADALQAQNTRLILDRYINDMTKSFQKKILATDIGVEAFGFRDAPRTDDVQRLNELVDVMLKKQKTLIEQRIAQADKEYQSLVTRIQTQGGGQSDLDRAEAEYNKLLQELNGSLSDLANAGSQIRQRGLDKIEERESKRIQKDAEAKAQEAGERIFEEYLNANKEQLEPTLKEYATAVIGDLIGPYSAIRKDGDERLQRRKRLLDEAEERAAEEARRVYEEEVDKARAKAQLPPAPKSMRLTPEELDKNRKIINESDKTWWDVYDSLVKSGTDDLTARSKADEAKEQYQRSNPLIVPKVPEDFDFQTPRSPEGFQLQDIPSMARFIRGSAPFIALTALDQVVEKFRSIGNQGLQGLTDSNQTTMQVLDKLSLGAGAFGSDIPLNVGGKILEGIFSQVEKVAMNTSREVLPFAPNLLDATINSRLRLLEFNMERAGNVDTTLAAITDSNTELQIALSQLADRLLTEFGPALVGLTSTLTVILEFFKDDTIITKLLGGAFTMQFPFLKILIESFWKVGKAKMDELEAQRNAMKAPLGEIEDFLNPDPDVNLNIPIGI